MANIFIFFFLLQVKQPLHPGGEFYPEGRRSIAEAVVEEVVAQQQSQQQQQQQQSSGTS
ncbi:hypothetical protein AAP_05880 [Ascosphaera apis ARSEF 7405]|uniref:Uncharacterized protein n=1 Tax=Ascosphaera apis ARSEF 7405 TaxID=392613 RepID=A0A167V6T1_9EURO|nr:hypothetical protein AAP_05880 [Ascosphaera apis ARSEF 7405]